MAKKGHILHAMLYDLLFSQNKDISGGGTLKKLVLAHSTRINAELTRIKVKSKVTDSTELIPAHLRQNVILPRWVRVNLLKTDVKTAKYFFEKDGWVEIPFDQFFEQLEVIQAQQAAPKQKQEKSATAPKSKADASSSEKNDKKNKTDTEQDTDDKKSKKHKMGKVYCCDRDLPDLLAFPPLTDLHDHMLLHAGHIVLQDKASALSGAALNAPAERDTFALDACAAPGQKTSQVAQSMKNMGQLFAFDLSADRLEVLKKLCKRNGLKNLRPINASFLDIDVHAEPYCDVEYILLDPSCSGSGIVNRFDYFLSSNEDDIKDEFTVGVSAEAAMKERVLKLQEFQLSMIQKAFTFPRLKRLVYSTCSIHDEENEQVVEKALALKNAGHFDAAQVLPHVPMRGKTEYPHGELCVRTDAKRDHTIGFFVSLFERKATSELPAKKRKEPTPDQPQSAMQDDENDEQEAPRPTKQPKKAEGTTPSNVPAPKPKNPAPKPTPSSSHSSSHSGYVDPYKKNKKPQKHRPLMHPKVNKA